MLKIDTLSLLRSYFYSILTLISFAPLYFSNYFEFVHHLVIISTILLLQYSVLKKNFPQTMTTTISLVTIMTVFINTLDKKCQQLTYEFLSIFMALIINIFVNNMLITRLHMSTVTRIRENHCISISTYIFF